jgi:hypothetical protein
MVKVSFNLPEEVYEALRKKAYEEHVAMTDIIIGALAEKPLKNSVVHPVIKGPVTHIPPHEDIPVIKDTVGRPAGEMNADDYLGQVPWGK